MLLSFCFAPTSKKNHLFAHKYLHTSFFMLIFVYTNDKDMTYFLRYTSNAESDLERNESFHSTPFRKGEMNPKKVAKALDCAEDDIRLMDEGMFHNKKNNGIMGYFQALDGLCGFELEADNLEDAIEEAEEFYFNSVYNSNDMTDWAIFEGVYNDDCPEGVMFSAIKIAYKK